jgi:aminoglycoside phosphotransferase family enzyme/predicted kinase
MSHAEPLDPEVVPALCRPAGLGIDASAAEGVDHIQTHISHLFLTRDSVYKLRKSVELSFLSFATREARNADCLREVELNRRLAADVYLGVAPILRDDGNGWRLGEVADELRGENAAIPGAETPAAEHCVVMRRLPDGRDALSMLEADALEPRHIEALAELLVEFHRRTNLGTPAPWLEGEWLDRTRAPIDASFALAREAGHDVIDPGELDGLEAGLRSWLEDHRDWLLARREAGRAVDGHGDLHLDHVWYPQDDEAPVAIDCIEFDAELRKIDIAAELAFFVMDTAYRGRDDLGEMLLAYYAAASDDYDLYRVVDLHVQHRALVRGSVAAVACNDAEVSAAQREAAAESARRHVALMARLQHRRPAPALLLTTGLPGTGKSTAAAAAASAVGAVPVVADRVRKHLAGLAPAERGDDDAGHGIYSDESTAAVYQGLLERAAPVLDSGRPVVLDATYSQQSQRAGVAALAMELGVPALLLEVISPEEVTRTRIRERLRDPRRISDADERVFAQKQLSYEPPTEWPEAHRITVDTHLDDWRDRLQAELLRRMP